MVSDVERAVCRQCGEIAAVVSLGADRWAACHTCGVRWWTGGDADARPQDAAEVAAVVGFLQGFQPSRPIDATIALVPSAMEQRLDAIRRALGVTPAGTF